MRSWLSRAQRGAGIEVTGAIHRLRHTFCSMLAAEGAPPLAIQQLAGHSHISTTMKYMHLAPQGPGCTDEAAPLPEQHARCSFPAIAQVYLHGREGLHPARQGCVTKGPKMRLQMIGIVGSFIACAACSSGPESDGAEEAADQNLTSSLQNSGTAAYTVKSVSGSGTHCINVPSALFGAAGDTVNFSFTSAGATASIKIPASAADQAKFGAGAFSLQRVTLPAGTHRQPLLGGSVDTMTGMYTSANVFSFVDNQTRTSQGNQGKPFYTVTITRSGGSLTVATMNQGAIVACQLDRKQANQPKATRCEFDPVKGCPPNKFGVAVGPDDDSVIASRTRRTWFQETGVDFIFWRARRFA